MLEINFSHRYPQW